SCPCMSRASTSFVKHCKIVVDGRNKSGHDSESHPFTPAASSARNAAGSTMRHQIPRPVTGNVNF
ncbi:MAG: hypothetical protein ACRCXM_03470, partial [Beijerinckiaceae bacterium]